jgi:tol-pal system protein YbgF
MVAGAAGFVVTGCATSGTVRDLSTESRLTQSQVTDLTRAQEEVRGELAALRKELQALRQEVDGTLRERERVQREGLEELAGRMAATEKRMESLAGAVRGVEMSVGGMADQVARLEAVSTGAAASRRDGRPARGATRPAVATLAADDLFARAMESFKNGELAQAILDFEDFVARYPSHAQAGVAQFWIGEAYHNARDYQHATVEYRKAVEMAAKGEKTPEALFKLGLAYRMLKRPDRARDAWAQLLRDFPQSEAAQKARLAMREVGRAVKPGVAVETR